MLPQLLYRIRCTERRVFVAYSRHNRFLDFPTTGFPQNLRFRNFE
jgi:hypothetical protein